jgi:hypothetical protein
MKISLDAETAQRIRGVLGDDVDLAPDVIPSVLARLAVEAPTIYSQVLSEISGSQIRLDSEEELHKRQRRGLLRRLLFSWGEYETGVGDRLLAKRHVAASVPLGIAGLTMALLILTLLFGHRGAPSSAQRSVVAPEPPRGRAALERAIPYIIAPRSESVVRATAAGERAPLPMPPMSHASPAAYLPLPSIPTAPNLRGVPTGAPGNPIVVSPPASPLPDAAHDVALDRQAAPIVYNRVGDEVGAAHATTGEETSSRPPEIARASTDTHLPTGAVERPWSSGMRVPGRLLTGVVVISGAPPVPVVIETENPQGIWLGQAVLGPGDRVQVIAQLEGRDRAGIIRGVALDPDQLVPGLAGRTSMRHPAVAAAVATAALQATADYAQAVVQQGNFGIFAGWGQFPSSQAGPAWTYFASRLAQAVDPRATAGTWVATTEVPAGRSLIMLIMGAQ